MRAGRFACWHCQRVIYTSQSCDLIDRMWRKQSKVESLLDDAWTRPIGMRQRTYVGLLETLENCEERRDTAFDIRVMQLLGLQF